MKKFNIFTWEKGKFGLINSPKNVVIININLNNPKGEFNVNDIIVFFVKLKLDYTLFDLSYTSVDYVGFVSNDDYDVSFFFVEPVNTIYMSIVCNSSEAKQKLDKLIEDMKNVEEGKFLEE